MIKKMMLGTLILFSTTLAATAQELPSISHLESRILRYTDSRATTFLNQFTPESVQGLWEVLPLLNDSAAYESGDLYNRLNFALDNLQLAPRRFGMVSVSAEDNPHGLAFRSSPDRGHYLGSRLPHGTFLEILAEVQGESVSWNTDWLRVFYNGFTGYVHSRYVQNHYVSAHRRHLLANLSRSQLNLQSKYEGWQVAYAPQTTQELGTIWREAQQAIQQSGNLFALPYYQLDTLIANFSIDHLNLVTLSRAHLLEDISELYTRIQSQNPEEFTEESWAQMEEYFLQGQAMMVDNWEHELGEPELDMLHDLLHEGFRVLRRIPVETASEPVIPEVVYHEVATDWQEILLFGALVIIIPVGGILLFKRKPSV